MSKLVHGVGINDVDYTVNKMITLGYINGKQIQKRVWMCPYYRKWASLLKRCYSSKYQTKYPTYIGCTVDPEWLYLSNFIRWVDNQPNRDWQNCELDKDLLFVGNKHYGHTTCVFLTKQVNYFTLLNESKRGEHMIGVSYSSLIKHYRVQCRNPFIRADNQVGYFATELEAHKAWQAKKHEYACQLADLQDDLRVADALRQRYTSDKDWTKA